MARFVVRIGTTVVPLALLVAFVACVGRPAPGKPCKKVGAYICTDPATALYCNAGVLQAIPCKGTRGCSGGAVSPSCDDDLAQEGDACMATTNENYACSTDHKKMLLCKDGKYAMKRKCGGPSACEVKSTLNEVDCDYSISEAGDPCMAGKVACTPDAKMALRCVGDKFVNDNACRGPKGCRSIPTGVDCDETVSMEGDPCDTDQEASCTMDAKSELICQASKYVKKRDCRGGKGCWVAGHTLHCD